MVRFRFDAWADGMHRSDGRCRVCRLNFEGMRLIRSSLSHEGERGAPAPRPSFGLHIDANPETDNPAGPRFAESGGTERGSDERSLTHDTPARPMLHILIANEMRGRPASVRW